MHVAEAEKVSPGVVTHRVVLLKIVGGIDKRMQILTVQTEFVQHLWAA